MLKTTITDPSFKNRVVGFLFDSYANSIDSELRYKDIGFQDVFPDSEDSQFDAEWGPAKGILTVEGQKYGDNKKYRDLTIGLFKLFLIKLEVQRWITNYKQALVEIKKLLRCAVETTERKSYTKSIEATV